MIEQPLFPTWFGPNRQGLLAPKRKTFAIYPDGTESEIVKRGDLYRVQRPDGKREENTKLNDLKAYLAQDIPGTTFASRK